MKTAPKLAKNKQGLSLIKFESIEDKSSKKGRDYTQLEFTALSTRNQFEININVIGQYTDRGDIFKCVDAMGFVYKEETSDFGNAPDDFEFGADAGETVVETNDDKRNNALLDFLAANAGQRFLAKILINEDGYEEIDFSSIQKFEPKAK